jgi:hypothetical protein
MEAARIAVQFSKHVSGVVEYCPIDNVYKGKYAAEGEVMLRFPPRKIRVNFNQ